MHMITKGGVSEVTDLCWCSSVQECFYLYRHSHRSHL